MFRRAPAFTASAEAARDARQAAPDCGSGRHRMRGSAAGGTSGLHLSLGHADRLARALYWVSTVHMPTGEGALRLQWTARGPVGRADLGAIFATDCKDNPVPSRRGLVYLREMGGFVVAC